MEIETVLLVGLVALVGGAGIGFLLTRTRTQRRNSGHPQATPPMPSLSPTPSPLPVVPVASPHHHSPSDQLSHLTARENELTQRQLAVEQRAANLVKQEELLLDRQASLDISRREVEELRVSVQALQESLLGDDIQQAKQQIMEQAEEEARRQAMIKVRDTEIKAREEAERRARRILATAIQRLSSEVVADATTTEVMLPTDEMKGRIIGRDGRNIKSFEAITGVKLLIDDAPAQVSLSSFDPVRREMARITLDNLVADGRIHPLTIEEEYHKAQSQVEQSILDAGEWALLETGISRMHPELMKLLGQLKYRTSYGQNVLTHLVESAWLAQMLSSELGIEPAPVVRSALLHDIGKAVTHQVSGSHALIGAELAHRFDEDAAVVHGIEAHHNDVDPRTILAVLVQAADAVSAARPGARQDNLENYVQRLERIEQIAHSFEGVQEAYAISAGRAVRVMVDPGLVDDLAASDLSRRIARRIETELHYPGQIEVTVVREYRSTSFTQ